MRQERRRRILCPCLSDNISALPFLQGKETFPAIPLGSGRLTTNNTLKHLCVHVIERQRFRQRDRFLSFLLRHLHEFQVPIFCHQRGTLKKKTLLNSHILYVSTIQPLTCGWSLTSAISLIWADFQVTKDPVGPQQASVEFWLTADRRIKTHFKFLSDIISVKAWNVPASGGGSVISIYGINLR